MAISASLNKNLPGGIVLSLNDLYWHLSIIQHDVNEKRILAGFNAWLDSNRRNYYKRADASVFQMKSILKQAEASYKENPTQHRERNLTMAMAAYQAALDERSEFDRTEFNCQFEISDDDYFSMLNEDEDVIRSKIYKWAMSKFENSKEV
jgi:hypothetical protein